VWWPGFENRRVLVITCIAGQVENMSALRARPDAKAKGCGDMAWCSDRLLHVTHMSSLGLISSFRLVSAGLALLGLLMKLVIP
jgi:hypothetical protein